MAGDRTVEIEDEGTVTVDISDMPGLEEQAVVTATPSDEPDNTDEVVEQKPVKRQRQAKTTDAAEEASAALNQALETAKREEEARKTAEQAARSAEATAMAERRRAEDASRLASQRESEANSYREQAESRELSLINNGIDSATRELASAQTELQRAMEAGEFDKAVSAQVKLSKAAASLDRLEDSKINYEANLARRPATTEGRVESVRPATNDSAFEKFLSGFDPIAQSWLRSHPECAPAEAGGDRTKNAKMMAGHYAAVAEGRALNSPEYYRVIEEHTGHRTPVSIAATTVTAGEEDDPPPVATKSSTPKPRQAQPSAPVSRDAPGRNGAPMSRQVTLTPEQQEVALISFQQKPGETDGDFRKRAYGNYATELTKAQHEGKIGRRFDNM